MDCIEGTFIRERHRFENASGDTIIGDFEVGRKYVTVKGPSIGPHPGVAKFYKLHGKWSEYINKYTRKPEKQFHYEMFEEAQPRSRTAILSFVASIPQMNAKTAEGLYKKFGNDLLDIAANRPDELIKAGVHRSTATRIRKAVELHRHNISTAVEIAGLLHGKGFPRKVWQQVMDEAGPSAPSIIRENPFWLMKFDGVGFRLADRLWLELGKDPSDIRRQKECVVHFMSTSSSGSTLFCDSEVLFALAQNIGSVDFDVDKVVKDLEQDGRIEVFWCDDECRPCADGHNRWIQLASDAEHEIAIAKAIEQIERLPGNWPVWERDLLDLTDHQRERLMQTLNGEACIFGGGPGTGKTFCSARVVKQLINTRGRESVLLVAFTGKAAVRSTEVMYQNGVDIKCVTIHSALATRLGHDGKLKCSFVVIDEPSMIDCELMAALLSAMPEHAKLLLVGDVRQLPPVGRGAPLRDMIAGGVSFTEITEVNRNAGAIVRACHQVVTGKVPDLSRSLFDNGPLDNLAFMPLTKTSELLDCIAQYQKFIESRGMHPVNDLQIICAVNERGEFNRKAINKHLQATVTGQPAKWRFNLHDRVICRKNQLMECEDESLHKFTSRVANGEQGRVTNLRDYGKWVEYTVELQSPYRKVTVREFEGVEDGFDWELAYAISCHSSQGSEFPFTMVVADPYPGAVRLCSREWWNTAISRARIGCVIVGDIQALATGVRRTSTDERRTMLAWRIKGLA